MAQKPAMALLKATSRPAMSINSVSGAEDQLVIGAEPTLDERLATLIVQVRQGAGPQASFGQQHPRGFP